MYENKARKIEEIKLQILQIELAEPKLHIERQHKKRRGNEKRQAGRQHKKRSKSRINLVGVGVGLVLLPSNPFFG